MKVVTPEGYTFVTKFQEDNSHKVLRSVDFFSIKFDEIFLDTVCWVAPVLAYFDNEKTVHIQCDASERGLGAALLQNGKPVSFASIEP